MLFDELLAKSLLFLIEGKENLKVAIEFVFLLCLYYLRDLSKLVDLLFFHLELPLPLCPEDVLKEGLLVFELVDAILNESLALLL